MILMILVAGGLCLYFAALSGESKFLQGGSWSDWDAKGDSVASWSPDWRLESTMRRKGLDAMWRRCFLASSSRTTLSTLRVSTSVIRRFIEKGHKCQGAVEGVNLIFIKMSNRFRIRSLLPFASGAVFFFFLPFTPTLFPCSPFPFSHI